MFNCALSAIAKRVIIDAQSQQLSIIDYIETIQSQTFPVIMPSLSCVFVLHRDDTEDTKLSFNIVAKIDDTEIINFPGEADFKDKKITRTILNFEGFVIPKAGNLSIKITKDNITLGETVTPISKIELPRPQVSVTNK